MRRSAKTLKLADLHRLMTSAHGLRPSISRLCVGDIIARQCSSPFIRLFKCIALLIVLALPSLGAAQTATDPDRSEIEQRKAALESVEAMLPSASAEMLLSLRTEVRRVRSEALSAAPDIEERRNRLAAELEALGPAPAEGADEEAAEVATERARLTELLAGAEFLYRQSQLNQERASALLNEIAQTRRAIFYEGVLTRRSSPLDPSIFGAGITGFLAGVQSSIMSTAEQNWTKGQRKMLPL